MNLRMFLRGATPLFPLLLTGCNSSDVAGTSSGVDNPQIMVAFTSGSGTPSTISGSLSIYQANQNPALDPNPILEKRVEQKASINLSRSDFLSSADTGIVDTINVLLINDDSTGGLLQKLIYNSSTRKFSSAGNDVSSVNLKLAALVNYSGTLDRPSGPGGLERIFIPGTPYQAVVVDSGFSLGKIPPGTFPARLITNQGVELPLPDSLHTDNYGPQHVDPNAPPIQRPPPPPPPQLKVDAGPDRNVSKDAETFLQGKITGAVYPDPHLALLWRQIGPDPQTTRALLESPTALVTHVTFPKPGPYRFIFSANYGTGKSVEDTVLITVQ